MKRILIFSLAYFPKYVGGAEIAIKEITDRIDSNEIQFDMITLRFDSALPKKELVGNVAVHRIGFAKKNPTHDELTKFPMYMTKVFYPLLAFLKAVQLYRKEKYDKMWCMMSYMGFPAVLFQIFYKQIPFILTLQEGDTISHITKRWRIRLVSPLYKLVFRRASLVQVISKYLGNFAEDMGFREKLVVISNGVDVEKFRIQNSEFIIKKLKNTLGFRDTDKILITTSRLVTKNAVDVIIKSLKYLPENVKLIVVGAGPEEKKLHTAMIEKGLEDRMKFLGYVSHENLLPYIQCADVFVRPSRSEGMGISFIEAMATGVPVVATPVGGIVDFISHQETGMFAEVDNPQSVAEQVRILLKDNALRQQIITNARALVEEKYDWDSIAQEIKNKVFSY
jgi:glycosyltransferase involved in cell wall biosynthesis